MGPYGEGSESSRGYLVQHTVRFTNGFIGHDDYEGHTYIVRPAYVVLAYIEKPRDPPGGFMPGFATSQWEAACKMLTDLGNAMVVVQSFGICVGDFSISPYLVSPEQFYLLRELEAA